MHERNGKPKEALRRAACAGTEDNDGRLFGESDGGAGADTCLCLYNKTDGGSGKAGTQ